MVHIMTPAKQHAERTIALPTTPPCHFLSWPKTDKGSLCRVQECKGINREATILS